MIGLDNIHDEPKYTMPILKQVNSTIMHLDLLHFMVPTQRENLSWSQLHIVIMVARHLLRQRYLSKERVRLRHEYDWIFGSGHGKG